MPEPMLEVAPTRNWNPLSREQFRKRYGPSNPLHTLLETLSISDVCQVANDDFVGVLATDDWTSTVNGGTAFTRVANRPSGVVRGETGAVNAQDSRLYSDSELVTANRRPVMIGRIGMNSAVTTSKFEFGFTDVIGAGAVLVKATPTSTATDYAVIVRDTDDDVLVSMVTDGGTDTAGSVDPSPGLASAFATQTWYNMMIAVNEVRECVYYVDGTFRGIRRAGPDATATLMLWVYIQTRDGADRTLDVDFIKAWQERVPFSGNAFTT